MYNWNVYLRTYLSPVFLGVVVLFAMSARADRIVTLTFTTINDPNITYSGTLVLDGIADPHNSHALDIQSVTGTINGVPGTINGLNLTLAPIGSGADSQHPKVVANGHFLVDNVYYFGSAPFDINGLWVSDGNHQYYDFFDGALVPYIILPQAFQTTDEVIYPSLYPSLSSLPEPGTFSLLGTGLLAVAGIARRRVLR